MESIKDFVTSYLNKWNPDSSRNMKPPSLKIILSIFIIPAIHPEFLEVALLSVYWILLNTNYNVCSNQNHSFFKYFFHACIQSKHFIIFGKETSIIPHTFHTVCVYFF